jgi:magnesium chelatase subunit D
LFPGDDKKINMFEEQIMIEDFPLPLNPYPEDTAPIEREAYSLRLPLRHYSTNKIGRGVAIGTLSAVSLHDLALVATLFAAAPFQPIRRKHHSVTDSQRFLLAPTDLRSYRRMPIAEQMLLLLVDYTCLDACNWQEALQPYLAWAYIERARVCIIQVGKMAPAHELQSERILARNILASDISAALDAKRGRATPLAHGLDLALQTLHHTMEHGRSAVKHAVCVIISDGRGNVTLDASRTGLFNEAIAQDGVEDALLVARSFCKLKNVHCVLLNPQPLYYPQLPLALAAALGASVVNIQSLAGTEQKL